MNHHALTGFFVIVGITTPILGYEVVYLHFLVLDELATIGTMAVVLVIDLDSDFFLQNLVPLIYDNQ